MKKIGIVLVVLLAVAAIYLVVNKSYYPALPIENVTTKEAIDAIENSDEKIVELATDQGSVWYITKSVHKGTVVVDEIVKQLVSSRGWEFKEKLGAGLFFEKEDEILIVTTQMWTKNYVLVQVQEKFQNEK